MADPDEFGGGPFGGQEQGLPPVISGHVPAPLSAITNGQNITFQVLDDLDLLNVTILVKYGSGAWEVAWDGQGQGDTYVVIDTGTSESMSYDVSKLGGWPDPSLDILVIADDVEGLQTRDQVHYTVTDPVSAAKGKERFNRGLN